MLYLSTQLTYYTVINIDNHSPCLSYCNYILIWLQIKHQDLVKLSMLLNYSVIEMCENSYRKFNFG